MLFLFTWFGGICLPLIRSNNKVPKLYVTLSRIKIPEKQVSMRKSLKLFSYGHTHQKVMDLGANIQEEQMLTWYYDSSLCDYSS